VRLRGYSLQAILRDKSWPLITYTYEVKVSNESVVRREPGIEECLLEVVLQQMNMIF
jgi:hypothetical protein